MRLILKIKRKLTKRRHAEIPLTGAYMSTYSGAGDGDKKAGENGEPSAPRDPTAPQPTYANFSPNQQTASQRRNQRSVLIHQKSPLLVSTPPQVTRALAYSHPYILPLERLAGLVAWRSGDPWESFLLLAVFWFVTLYIDDVLRWAGPVVIVIAMIVGLYTRRYSPLSSTTWTDAKSKRKRADSEARKSLDDILNTLQRFTTNCEACIEPFRQLSEFLSTQSTPTSATTRPALTTLFIRILAFTPIWIVLTLPPLRIITTQRIVLVLGTTALSWHSRYAQICRSVLWKSRTVKRCIALLTGLDLDRPGSMYTEAYPPPLPPRARDIANSKGKSPGVRFTFTIYENERRWLGLGWTKQLATYERQAYTDDHLDECPAPESYTLPETDNETTKWRWVKGSAWHVEGMTSEKEKSAKRIGGGGGGDESGWVYCDGKWQDPRKVDGWSRYTRRRKWIRDAELVEVEAADDADAASLAPSTATATTAGKAADDAAETSSIDTSLSAATVAGRRRGWFKQRTKSGRVPIITEKDKEDAKSTAALSTESKRSRSSFEEDVHTPLERIRQFDWDRSYNEDMGMQLG